MPHSLELPRMRSAVVKLVRREWFAGFIRGVVNKLIALALRHAIGRGHRLAGWRSRLKPRLAAVVRALNDLAKPATRLRCVNAVRVNGRTFHVVNLPSGKVWATYVPVLTFSI